VFSLKSQVWQFGRFAFVGVRQTILTIQSSRL
jgi:hypothetical protein